MANFCPQHVAYPEDEDAAVLSITEPPEEAATEEEKATLQKLWKKNMNKDVERRKIKMQRQLLGDVVTFSSQEEPGC